MRTSISFSALLYISTLPVNSCTEKGDENETCSFLNGSCIISNNCVDKHEDCLMWAEFGECQKNKVFMESNCMQSCELCVNPVITSWRTNIDCEDRHPNCDVWASHGECITNPGYMSQGCSKSCNVCIDVGQARNEGIKEGEIFRRYIFALGNWGEKQTYGGNEFEKVKVKNILMSMKHYTLNNVTKLSLEERLLCDNLSNNCAFWASLGSCEDNLPFMMEHCALACRFCHMRLKYQNCLQYSMSTWMDDSDYQNFQNLWLNRTYLSIKKTRGEAELVSIEKKEEIIDLNDPWVLKIENFISFEEADEILLFAKTFLEWLPSSSIPAKRGLESDDELVRQESYSAFCNIQKCKELEIYKNIRTMLLGLFESIEYHNLEEPIEFVQYQAMQSFGVHHDFDIHDIWKIGGPRVISVFLCLSDVEKGGAMGFPNLDWLSIPPRKGQLLIWPNVIVDKDKEDKMSMKIHKDMSSEGLPVIAGEKYGLQTWIRFGNYELAKKEKCS
mmetsp:Transcript_4906/g.5699  ORF Transcript_4906/g.5699 Transcript_4906/m.5699 type:complete len:501 (-) Transcript_4906:50-1552(-)